MKVRFIDQPAGGSLNTEILAALRSADLRRFWVASAWVSRPALRSLEPALSGLTGRVGTGECRGLFGIDRGGTSREGLEMAAEVFGEARVFHDCGGRLFHPKLYLFEWPDQATMIIGSPNLTDGGLSRNFEIATVIDLELGSASDKRNLKDAQEWFERLWSDPDGSRAIDSGIVNALAADPAISLPTEDAMRETIVSAAQEDASGPAVFTTSVRIELSLAVPASGQGRRPAGGDAGTLGTKADPSIELFMELLRDATGGESGIKPRAKPPIGSDPLGAELFMDQWKSLQRVALGFSEQSLVLCAWPGELMDQARQLYGTDRAHRLLAFLESHGEWSISPKPHLAYNGSRPVDRLYLTSSLSPQEYVDRWAEPENLEYARGHAPDTVVPELWPWLCSRGFAYPADAHGGKLDAYMERLTLRRSHANLRAGIEVSRKWSWSEVQQLDRDAVVSRIATATADLLDALEEPLPPALPAST